jgi:tetratricopeptide (TPR) repeat protein
VDDAIAWKLWAEADQRLRYLESRGFPRQAADLYRAICQAGSGRIDAAFDFLSSFTAGSDIPKWIELEIQAQLWEIAGKHEEAISFEQQAMDLHPGDPYLIYGQASSMLIHRRDISSARRLIEEAKHHAISDLLFPKLLMVEGLLLCEEGRAIEARSILKTALSAARKLWSASPRWRLTTDFIYLYLAWAESMCGNMELSRRYLRKAERRMRALNEDALFERIRGKVELLPNRN